MAQQVKQGFKTARATDKRRRGAGRIKGQSSGGATIRFRGKNLFNVSRQFKGYRR